jgi:hypothetical protein
MLVFPLILEMMFTNNSGLDVPNATTVRPITKSETLNLLAIEEAPATRKSAPFISKMNPTMSRI